MGLFSILPADYLFIETWLGRTFLLLGAFVLGPWVFLVIYDFILYLVRSATYEIPILGGRARGKARPRAPSLTERPDGHRRRFSLAPRLAHSPTHTGRNTKSDSFDPRWRNIQEDPDHHTGEDNAMAE
ncbi:hypothetical protein DM02DRAFT_39702 [Periconia macrospinosa]|uniref:Uncharacterized protein n=1 Tax=Periconia macrospinosa TaxID=97972 RepID=A0A2V1E7W1_9PLEO|nr:hypothetical protein DM02DRAFT_39702 [Periconia macrospinosa]